MFLDRDGVLTRSLVREGRPYAPRSLDEFHLLPDAADALALLDQAGYLLIVVTNQPDVATGQLAGAVLEEMHCRLREALPVDDVLTCLCLEADPECLCYKPRPGLLIEAAKKWGIDLRRSVMVGDRWRDIGAGKAAGCYTVFLDRHYAADRAPESPDYTAAALREACEHIVNRNIGIC